MTSFAIDMYTNMGFNNSAPVPLSRIADYLAEASNWNVFVDTDALNIPVESGARQGTFEQVVRDIAQAAGTSVGIDPATKTVHYQ